MPIYNGLWVIVLKIFKLLWIIEVNVDVMIGSIILHELYYMNGVRILAAQTCYA